MNVVEPYCFQHVPRLSILLLSLSSDLFQISRMDGFIKLTQVQKWVLSDDL